MKKNQDPIITQNETIQDLLELADQIWDAGSFDYMIDEWRQNPKASGYDEQMISWFLHLRGEIKQAKKNVKIVWPVPFQMQTLLRVQIVHLVNFHLLIKRRSVNIVQLAMVS